MKEIKGRAGANLVIFISWTILWVLIADSGEMDGISSGAIVPGENFAVEKFLNFFSKFLQENFEYKFRSNYSTKSVHCIHVASESSANRNYAVKSETLERYTMFVQQRS